MKSEEAGGAGVAGVALGNHRVGSKGTGLKKRQEPGPANISPRTPISAEEEIPSSSGKTCLFCLLEPSTDWMRPTDIMEGNLLYSESVD